MIWESLFLCGVILFSTTAPLTGWVAFCLLRRRDRDLEREQATQLIATDFVRRLVLEVESCAEANARDVATIEQLIGARRRTSLPN